MTSHTNPQVPSEQVPSAERREEVRALWEAHGNVWLQIYGDSQHGFLRFIAALYAQSAERTRAEVEKMRKALVEIKRVSIPKTYIHDLCANALPIKGTSR